MTKIVLEQSGYKRCYVCGQRLYKRKFNNLLTGEKGYQWVHLTQPGTEMEAVAECKGNRN